VFKGTLGNGSCGWYSLIANYPSLWQSLNMFRSWTKGLRLFLNRSEAYRQELIELLCHESNAVTVDEVKTNEKRLTDILHRLCGDKEVSVLLSKPKDARSNSSNESKGHGGYDYQESLNNLEGVDRFIGDRLLWCTTDCLTVLAYVIDKPIWVFENTSATNGIRLILHLSKTHWTSNLFRDRNPIKYITSVELYEAFVMKIQPHDIVLIYDNSSKGSEHYTALAPRSPARQQDIPKHVWAMHQEVDPRAQKELREGILIHSFVIFP
jgi:hypothetical protein